MSSRSSSRKYFEMLRELEEYMRHKQLPVSLQNRLLEYYEFKFQKSYFRESEILNILSGQLKQVRSSSFVKSLYFCLIYKLLRKIYLIKKKKKKRILLVD